MRLLYGKRYDLVMARMEALVNSLKDQTSKNLELASQLAYAHEECENLKKKVQELSSPAAKAAMRAQLEKERISEARKALISELPKEVADKIDWESVDWI